MSLAAEAREALRTRPALHYALRTGVLNYRAAADSLDIEGDTDAVATALRRYGDELEPATTRAVDATVRMQSGVGLDEDDGEERTADEREDVVVAVGETRVVRGGEMTAVRATGSVDAAACQHVLARLVLESILVDAFGCAGGGLVVVVPRRQGATALRIVEDALAAVPA